MLNLGEVKIGDHVKSDLCPLLFGRVISIQSGNQAFVEMETRLLFVNLGYWSKTG